MQLVHEWAFVSCPESLQALNNRYVQALSVHRREAIRPEYVPKTQSRTSSGPGLADDLFQQRMEKFDGTIAEFGGSLWTPASIQDLLRCPHGRSVAGAPERARWAWGLER